MADRIGQQLGNYTLVRFLGRGGQAEVYLGEHRYLKSFAALKVLHASLDEQHAEQFLAEAQTLARLVHPSIVRVLDFTIEQGMAVLIMDYSPTGTMRQRYPTGTCLPLAAVVSAVSQVASALHYAHSKHVIHRDVKPENLLLGPRDEVLLSDFGLSVFAPSPELLSTQAMAGTLPYMAPEQLQGHPCFASDQYSLAIVAYEWLTGTRPFRGSQWQLIQQQLYAPPPSLRERNPAVPAEVEAVVLRALSKDPGQRYASVEDFARELARASQEMRPATAVTTRAPLQLPQAEPQDASWTLSDQSTLPRSSLTQQTERSLTLAVLSPEQHNRTEQMPSRDKDVNRHRLLAKVRAFWITGVLEHSLHGAALIALGLHEQPDAVANPWHLVLEAPGESGRVLPAGTSIVQVYDEAVGELLILGEPGSGKTTLLLELARTLLDRAGRDERHPMPVVFNLSSWASKRQPFELWLIDELNMKYQVPRKMGKAWIEGDQILPLLDGLDEVASSARSACVEAINVYRLQHGLVPTVVCSRSAEYLAEPAHILLRKAVVVQPLTEEQIETYLRGGSEQLKAVHQILQDDLWLRAMTTTPLMLSVLTLAYYGKAVEDLPAAVPLSPSRFEQAVTDLRKAYGCLLNAKAATPEAQRAHLAVQTASERLLLVGRFAARRQQLFAAYVERMLYRRSPGSYPSRRAIHWLSWLAKTMVQHNQTVFSPKMSLEKLSNRPSRTYYIVGALVFGLSVAPLGLLGLLLGVLGIGVGVALGNLLGSVLFVVGGLLVGLLGIGLPVGLGSLLFGGLDSVPGSVLGGVVGIGLLVGLCSALFVALSYGTFVLFFVLILWLIGGLIIGSSLLVTSRKGRLSNPILRWYLYRAGSLPWHYRHFLDYAAEHILLRKVGQNYIFIHRLLLEHFASLDTTSHLENTSKHKRHKDH